MGRQATEIPLTFLFPLLQALITYYIIGFNDHSAGKLFLYFVIMIGQSLAGNSFGLLLGSAFDDPKVAISIAPMFANPFMIFAGFYINSSNIPVYVRWLQYLSPFKYSLEALATNEFNDSAFSDRAFEQQDFDLGLGNCILILFVLGIVFRGLALVSLKALRSRL